MSAACVAPGRSLIGTMAFVSCGRCNSRRSLHLASDLFLCTDLAWELFPPIVLLPRRLSPLSPMITAIAARDSEFKALCSPPLFPR